MAWWIWLIIAIAILAVSYFGYIMFFSPEPDVGDDSDTSTNVSDENTGNSNDEFMTKY